MRCLPNYRDCRSVPFWKLLESSSEGEASLYVLCIELMKPGQSKEGSCGVPLYFVKKCIYVWLALNCKSMKDFVGAFAGEERSCRCWNCHHWCSIWYGQHSAYQFSRWHSAKLLICGTVWSDREKEAWGPLASYILLIRVALCSCRCSYWCGHNTTWCHQDPADDTGTFYTLFLVA